MRIARDLQARAIQVPATMLCQANWLEYYASKLELGIPSGGLMEPRTILTVVNDTLDTVISKDGLPKNI
eukprot:1161229-Prorocentrum_lima.AAC.1